MQFDLSWGIIRHSVLLIFVTMKPSGGVRGVNLSGTLPTCPRPLHRNTVCASRNSSAQFSESVMSSPIKCMFCVSSRSCAFLPQSISQRTACVSKLKFIARSSFKAPDVPWQTELEGMNTSIEEESLEPDAPLEPVSFNLDDIERVYLVGVEVKRKRSSVTKFSGSFRHL